MIDMLTFVISVFSLYIIAWLSTSYLNYQREMAREETLRQVARGEADPDGREKQPTAFTALKIATELLRKVSDQ